MVCTGCCLRMPLDAEKFLQGLDDRRSRRDAIAELTLRLLVANDEDISGEGYSGTPAVFP
jgi:hypothetical protein